MTVKIEWQRVGNEWEVIVVDLDMKTAAMKFLTVDGTKQEWSDLVGPTLVLPCEVEVEL